MSRTSKASSPSPSQPSSVRRVLAALARGLGPALAVAAASTAFATIAGAAGRLHWTLDLFSHFALQLLAAQIILLATLAALRRYRLSLALLPFLALNAASVAPYLPRPGIAVAADAAGPHDVLTVVAVNTAAHNRLFGGLRNSLRTERPDFVVVSEYTPRWAGRFQELAREFPYRVEHLEPGAGGIALLSRHPLDRSALVDIGGRIAIDARATVGGVDLRIVGVHLSTPVSAPGSRRRALQLDGLRDLIGESQQPTIVLGDFNLSVYSPVYRDWLAKTGLSDSLRGRGPDISWPTWLPLLGMPIDHCLVSAAVEVLDHRRLTYFGSDHYPILARIRLSAGARTPNPALPAA